MRDTYTATAHDISRASLVLHANDASREERELLLRVRSGERDAFGRVVELYLPRAMSLAMRLLRHREDAEDLVQDAFLAALQHIDSFDLSRPLWPWLSRIIVNRGLDVASSRSTRSVESLPDDLSDTRPSPADAAERGEIRDEFHRTLAALPERRRLVVQLFEVDGFSVAEIAKLLDSSPATIRWHLHMARRQLRNALAPLRGG
ncbi:MAG TPA: sigma-70 family RNA polymerase sigma factor [Gemmatimonadaceae bacterium]|nr:sigma-70 family RNA polymerase sigma factor [Gemmatimonadaceae bacterium]